MNNPDFAHNALPFTQDEYNRRWDAVLAQFDEYGVDVVISTFNRNHQYLTGHDAFGAYGRPFYLIIAPDRPRMNVVREFDEATVRAESIPLDVRIYKQLIEAPDVCAEVIRSLGFDRGRIGLELDLLGLTPRDVRDLQERLPHATIVDVSRLVLKVADVKSAEEITLMRRIMEGTEAGVAGFYASLHEGVSEVEAAAQVKVAVESTGVQMFPRLALTFGARTALGHAVSSENRLKTGEAVYTELSGHLHDYTAGLVRSAICGRNPEAEDLYALSNAALEAAIAACVPGNLTGDVDAAARDVVERAGCSRTFRQRTGYSIGLQWATRGYTSLEPGGQDVLQPNMALHMPLFLTDEKLRFAVGCSETILVADGRAQILGDGDRELRFV